MDFPGTLDGSSGYYYFECTEDFTVQSDWLCGSIGECMRVSPLPDEDWIEMKPEASST